jgi:hypothetical protein
VRGRMGVGVTRELGGGSNEFMPEALAGLDVEHAFNDRHSVFGSVEYIPSLSEFPSYRLNSKAGYKMVIDPATKMNLQVGVADRYDSDPGNGAERNDIEYFLTLGWEF